MQLNRAKFDKTTSEEAKAVLAALNKNHKNANIQLGKEGIVQSVATLSSGSLNIDRALGVGGYPIGKQIEIYGPESSGKTTLALHAIAACQKAGGRAAFIDAEHALDMRYAESLGIDLEDLILHQPDHAEMALGIVDGLASSGVANLIVVDSVAALVPKAELDGDMGQSHPGAQARLMSQAFRKLKGTCNNKGVTVIWINQLRHKIGVMFGTPETTSGGNALKFYASIRLDIRRIGKVKEGDAIVGNQTRVKVVKNKVAPPYGEAEFDIAFGIGVNRWSEVLDLAVERGFIKRSGSWYSIKDEKLAQGRANAIQRLKEDEDLYENLKDNVLKVIFPDETIGIDNDEEDKTTQDDDLSSDVTGEGKTV
jgi:recombination protein RecA